MPRIYSQKKIFYVYLYLRSKDSEYGLKDSPYYAGKGKGKRAYTKHTFGPPKDKNRIQFIAKNMNEADAFQLEMLLINLYGRVDLGTGCLRNLTDGGDGSVGAIGKIVSEKHKKILSEKYLGKTYEERYGPEKAKKIKNNITIGKLGKTTIRKGKPLSEETKVLRKRNRRPMSQEARKNISKGKKGKKQSESHHAAVVKANRLKSLGVPTSEETKIKLRNIRNNRSEEENAKISAKISKALTGHKGARKGESRPIEEVTHIKDGIKNSSKTCEYCNKFICLAIYNRFHGEKCKSLLPVKNKNQRAVNGKLATRKVCEHCDKFICSSAYTRYHGDKCKKKK